MVPSGPRASPGCCGSCCSDQNRRRFRLPASLLVSAGPSAHHLARSRGSRHSRGHEMGREGILGGRPLGGGSQRGQTLLVALRTCLPCVNGGGDLAASLAGRPRRSPVHRGRSPGQPNGFSKEEGTTRPGHVNQWDGRLPFPSLPTPERWLQGCWPLRAHGRWDWLPGSRLCDKTLSTPPPGRPPGRFTGGPPPGSPRVAGLGALA